MSDIPKISTPSAAEDAGERPQPTDEANLAALEGNGNGGGGAEGGGSADIYEDDSDDADKNKTVYILEQAFENLKNAGFSENAIKKAYASGCVNEKTATQWITMQLDHPELNTPLDASFGRIVIKKKVILTPEQRVAKIAELKAKIAAKKEQNKRQEAENERAAEKARIAGGKIAMEMKEEMQARARAQAYAEQRREKEEEAIAKEKVQLQLAIDKLLRKGKSQEEAESLAKADLAETKRKRQEATDALMAERRAQRAAAANTMLGGGSGSPTAATEATAAASGGGSTWNLSAVLGEEQIAYSRAAAQPAVGGGASSAAAAAAPSRTIVSRAGDIEAAEPTDPLPPPTIDGFKALVDKMRASNPSGFETTVGMLRTVVSNIVAAPMDQKKRYLKASNSHYQSKIACTPYALSFLKLLGFQVGWIEGEGGKQEQTIVMNTVIMRRLFAALASLE